MHVLINMLNIAICLLVILYIAKWDLIYNASRQLIRNWPDWLCWTLFFPVSAFAWFIFVELSGNWYKLYSNVANSILGMYVTWAVLVYLLQSFIFISVAATIAPSYKLTVSIMTGMLLCIMYWYWPLAVWQSGKLFGLIVPVIAVCLSVIIVYKVTGSVNK